VVSPSEGTEEKSTANASLDRRRSEPSQGCAIHAQRGNVNGHVVRARDDGNDPCAMTLRCDTILFRAQARSDARLDDVCCQQHVNLSDPTEGHDPSEAPGCWISPTTGILWIETDDNTLADASNCMLLAAMPKRFGDDGLATIRNRADGSPDAAVRYGPGRATAPPLSTTPAITKNHGGQIGL
jgi:hypothetical protein